MYFNLNTWVMKCTSTWSCSKLAGDWRTWLWYIKSLWRSPRTGYW